MDPIIITLLSIVLLVWLRNKFIYRVRNRTITEIIQMFPEETEEHILNSISYEKHSDYCCGNGKGFNTIIAPYYLPKSEEDPTMCRLIRHLSECKECGNIDDGWDRGYKERRFRVVLK